MLSAPIGLAHAEAPSAPASSSTVTAGLSDDDRAAIMAKFDELGVKENVRASLLAKVEAGVVLDAESGLAEPLYVTDTKKDGKLQSREVYPDGSVLMTVVELEPARISGPSGGISPQAVSGCKVLSNLNGWIRRGDCRVDVSAATIGFAFQASYSVKTGYGRVDSYVNLPSSYYNYMPGRHYEDEGMYMMRSLSSGSSYAAVRKWVRTSVAGVTSYRYLEMRVLTSAWSHAWTS